MPMYLLRDSLVVVLVLHCSSMAHLLSESPLFPHSLSSGSHKSWVHFVEALTKPVVCHNCRSPLSVLQIWANHSQTAKCDLIIQIMFPYHKQDRHVSIADGHRAYYFSFIFQVKLCQLKKYQISLVKLIDNHFVSSTAQCICTS